MPTTIELGETTLDVVRKDIKNVHLSVYPPTGTVRITALRDDHYAVAEVVDGKPGLHDTVELVRP